MKLKGKFSGKRLAKVLAVLFVLVAIFYFWQPYRVQWIQRLPDPPLVMVPIEQTGLLARGKRVLIVVGHPDDDAFYVGGTLFTLKELGATVRLIVCTNGDKGYYPWGDSSELAKVRQDEEKACSAAAGVQEVVFLGLPDSRMSPDGAATDRIAEEIRDFQPDYLLAVDPQFPFRIQHRDHLASGEAALKAGKKAGYRGLFLLYATSSPNTAVDVTRFWPDVENLLATHKSQFYGDRLIRIRGFVKAYKIEAGEIFGPALADSYRACRLK